MRLFVGLPVPASPRYDEVTGELLEVAGGKARGVPPGSWHVTLRFLGDLDDPAPVREALRGALADAEALPCRVMGVGAFKDPRRARIVWAGVEAPGVEDLARRVVEATRDLGVPPDERDFRAHVTLARLRWPRDVSAFVARHRDTVLAEGVLDRVVLYRSTLKPHGPHYEREAEFGLVGEGEGAKPPSNV